MTSEAADFLAEIWRSGSDVRLVGHDRLKLVAPAALLSELAERVRAAKPMLLVALADIHRKATQAGGGGVSNPWRNSATVQHPPAESSPDRAFPALAADWRPGHREALAYWSAFHPTDEAARLAWGEMEHRWHMQYGERMPHWRCSGCREPIGELAALTLVDGCRVHLDTLDCLLSYGERWRSEAAAGLQALGLDPPPSGEP